MSNIVAAKKLKVGKLYKVMPIREDGSIIKGAIDCGAVKVTKITKAVIVTRHSEHPKWEPCFQVTESGYKYVRAPDDEPCDPEDENTKCVFVEVEAAS